jgi:hypothetical protein
MRQRYGLAPSARGGTGADGATPTQAHAETELAKSDTSVRQNRAEEKVPQVQLALDPGNRGDRALADKEARAKTENELALKAGASVDSLALARNVSNQQVPKAATPGQATSVFPATEVAYSFREAQGKPGEVTQRFAQNLRYRRNYNSPPLPNVLNAFQLVQSGRQIRIEDADGSTYVGNVETDGSPPALQAPERRTSSVELPRSAVEMKRQSASSAVAPQTASQPFQNVAFRVTGTNRTLNQLVVFQGNLLTTTGSLASIQAGNSGRGVQSNQPVLLQAGQALNLQNQLQLLNARVQGQALIGDNERIEIDASAEGR